jgi:hypothetical protein
LSLEEQLAAHNEKNTIDCAARRAGVGALRRRLEPVAVVISRRLACLPCPSRQRCSSRLEFPSDANRVVVGFLALLPAGVDRGLGACSWPARRRRALYWQNFP